MKVLKSVTFILTISDQVVVFLFRVKKARFEQVGIYHNLNLFQHKSLAVKHPTSKFITLLNKIKPHTTGKILVKSCGLKMVESNRIIKTLSVLLQGELYRHLDTLQTSLRGPAADVT